MNMRIPMSDDPVLFYPSKRESSFLDRLRALCIAEMKRLGDEEVGGRLNLLHWGVERLHWDSTWEAERAVRIAILLDLPVMQTIEGLVCEALKAYLLSSEVTQSAYSGSIRLVKTCGACPEQYDAFVGEKQVGYLRLRHGSFRVDAPDCGGEPILLANPRGTGSFESDERDEYLDKARAALTEWLDKHPEHLKTP